MAQQSAKARALVREYDLVVPWEQIATEAIAELKKLQKEHSLPGFRPGKAPVALLLRQFGRAIQENCAREKLQAIFDERLAADGLKFASLIDISSNKADWQGDSSFHIEFEVEPEVEAIEFSNINYLSFEHEPTKLSAVELDEELLKVKIANAGDDLESISSDSDYLQYGDIVYLSIYQQVSEAGDKAEIPLADNKPTADELQRVSELLGKAVEPDSLYWENVASFEQMYFGMTNKRLEDLVPGIDALAQDKVGVVKDTIIRGADGTSCLKVKIIFAERCADLAAPDDAQVAKYNLPDIANVEQLRAALTRSLQAQDQLDLYEIEKRTCDTALYFHFRELPLPRSWLYSEITRMRDQDINQLMHIRNLKRSQAEQHVRDYEHYIQDAHWNLIIQLVCDKYLEHYQSQLPEVSDADVADHLQLHYDAGMDLTGYGLIGGKDKASQLRTSKKIFDGYRDDPERVEPIKQQLRRFNLAKLFLSQASALSPDEWGELLEVAKAAHEQQLEQRQQEPEEGASS